MIPATLVRQNKRDHPSDTGNKGALSSLGLMPSVRLNFTWLLASPKSYIGMYTKQTQTMQNKAEDLRTIHF